MYLLTISIQKYWPQFIKFKNQRDKKGQDLFYLGFLYMLSICVFFFFFELQSLSPVLIFKMPIWHSIWISNRHLNMHVQKFSSVQFMSDAQSCPTLCDLMNCSMPSLPVHHQLPEFTQTHIHRVRDAIQPSHPLSSPSPPASNPSQHQSLFQWVNSSHEVAKVLEFQL